MLNKSHLKRKLIVYQFGKILGKGQFGVVYEAINQKTKQNVAIKVISIQLLQSDQKIKNLVFNEIKILSLCKNQNVLCYIDSFKDKHNVYIITEFCNNGTVQQYLKENGKIPQIKAIEILKGILNGFKGLHEVNAIHRDFKLDNVLRHNQTIKIADLGFSKQLQKQQSLTNTVLGSYYTMAPQVLDEKPYGRKADIWSLGVVYYQMLYGTYPFNGRNKFELKKYIKSGNIIFHKQTNISKQSQDFIVKCLTLQPSDRISWSQIYDHPLILKKQNQIENQPQKSKVQMKFQENKNYYLSLKQSDQRFYLFQPHLTATDPGLDLSIYDKEQKSQLNYKAEEKQFSKQIIDYEQSLKQQKRKIKFMDDFFLPKLPDYILNTYANHNQALFLICKKALIKMQKFVKQINSQRQKQKNNQIFINYYNSQKFIEFFQKISQDIQSFINRCYCYMTQLQQQGNDISEQFQDITTWKNQHSQVLIFEKLETYWFQLAQNMDAQQQDQLIYALKALQYYYIHEQIIIQEFQTTIKNIKRKEQLHQIDKKLFSI